MRNPWFWCVASLLAAAAALAALPAVAATVVEKRVVHTVDGTGVVEETRLRVRLESASDYQSWSPFPVYLDEHRTLERFSAAAERPDHSTVVLGKRDFDTLEIPGEGILHASQSYRVARFPPLPAGSILEIDYSVRAAPYFPGGAVGLAGDDPITSLSVEVRGVPAGFRFHIEGDASPYKVEAGPRGVRVTASDLAALDPPDGAPGEVAQGPTLHYGWGTPQTWADVGRWYEGLLDGLPRAAPEIQRAAAEKTAGLADRRKRLEALLGVARHGVRYVAVEMGIGGYRPSPPPEVLARRWGDCKDKAMLLVDLLGQAGIPAYPTLVRSSRSQGIDTDFPSPFQFNHMIVAVPADAVPLEDGDPVGGGYLFVDPTQERGSARWLHPSVQGQHALVVRPDGARLVEIPIEDGREVRRLVVDLAVDGDGNGGGKAALELVGGWADNVLAALAGDAPDQAEEQVRALMVSLLPGAKLDEVTWKGEESDVPRVVLTAAVRLASLLQGSDARPALQLPGLVATPSPSLLAERSVPLLLTPGVTEFDWRVRLPEGECTVAPGQAEVDNAVGSFRQTVKGEGGRVVVERRVEVRRREVGPDLFGATHDLALAEHRALRRRLRFRCGGPEATP